MHNFHNDFTLCKLGENILFAIHSWSLLKYFCCYNGEYFLFNKQHLLGLMFVFLSSLVKEQN